MCDLLKAVNRYLVREFDSDSALEKIPEDGIFHLAYTTYEFGEYSCAAEPPVQCSVSHLSRRSEPQ